VKIENTPLAIDGVFGHNYNHTDIITTVELRYSCVCWQIFDLVTILFGMQY